MKLKYIMQMMTLMYIFFYCITCQVRRHMVRTLAGGGGQHGGFNALDHRKIRQGSAGRLGTYD
jgi:hypothetical protein